MLNNKGNLLIESLFSFEVYLCIIIILISFYTIRKQSYNYMNHQYIAILKKEETLYNSNTFTEIIDMVLH